MQHSTEATLHDLSQCKVARKLETKTDTHKSGALIAQSLVHELEIDTPKYVTLLAQINLFYLNNH